jgi:hypothetical protein
MSDSEPCRSLRAKRAYGNVVSSAEPDWRDGLLATDCFWCLRTLMPWGPDGRPAVAGSCVQGRSCFRAASPEPEPLLS